MPCLAHASSASQGCSTITYATALRATLQGMTDLEPPSIGVYAAFPSDFPSCCVLLVGVQTLQSQCMTIYSHISRGVSQFLRDRTGVMHFSFMHSVLQIYMRRSNMGVLHLDVAAYSRPAPAHGGLARRITATRHGSRRLFLAYVQQERHVQRVGPARHGSAGLAGFRCDRW